MSCYWNIILKYSHICCFMDFSLHKAAFHHNLTNSQLWKRPSEQADLIFVPVLNAPESTKVILFRH